MDTERERIATIMQDLAAGDEAAVVALYLEFGGRMAPMVRRRLAHLGVRHPARHEVEGLVFDACCELRACARGWNPDGGALPWTWAARRIDALVAKSVGIYADPLDDLHAERLEQPPSYVSSGADDGAASLLAGAASSHAGASCLLDAFDAARVSERDRDIALEYALQRHLGDTSPAVTVGSAFGVRPDNVRQIFRRTRTRLLDVVRREDRFAALRDLPLLLP
jgi:hypothetical protein